MSGGGGYRGGGRGRGRGGRNYGRGGGYQSNRGGPEGPPPRLRPCSSYTTTGSCNNNNCRFAHIVKLHASVDASSPKEGGRHYEKAAVSSIAIWDMDGTIKIFTGSHDGFWRLWNSSQSFQKEFEHQIGRVECVETASNFLVCGFENATVALPSTKVGMIHAWNLASPTNPPLELHMQTQFLPYAHNQTVTSVIIENDRIVSGGRDGSLKLWAFDAAASKFVLKQSLHGHAGQVTGLCLVDNILWSASTDQSIRLWDLDKQGECQYLITKEKNGHSNAVTSLLKFTSPAGPFVLSSSLDGSIKAWNAKTGECVATETHGEGVVSMCIAMDPQNHPILLVGLEGGNIMGRNVVATPKTPAFCLLFTLSKKYTAGHDGAVKCIQEGPSSTFYSGGNDGKLLVWQITGDLGI